MVTCNLTHFVIVLSYFDWNVLVVQSNVVVVIQTAMTLAFVQYVNVDDVS